MEPLRHLSGWADWEAGLAEFERMLPGYAELRGTLAEGPDRLLKAFRLGDDLGQLSYRIWYYAGLTYDQDQRDNSANARRQKVQILFAKAEARSWFTPELLRIPLATVRTWMQENAELAVYRFAIESAYHQQEHVLDEKGEHLLSLSSRLGDVPHDVHSMLANADIKHPVIALHDGKQVTLTYGQYNALLQTNRHQPDRAAAFHAFHETFAANANTFAAVPTARWAHWFVAQARSSRARSRRRASTTYRRRSSRIWYHSQTAPTRCAASSVAQARARPRDLHAYDQLVPLIDFDRNAVPKSSTRLSNR
jgi:oligoendopeptidase F